MSTILSIVLVSAILGAAAYFLIKQSTEKPKPGTDNGSTGNSDNEDTNDTSGQGGAPGN